MALSLKESNAVTGMADVLAEFLPYSGAYEHRGQLTYRNIARKLGIGQFWVKSSKRPGIASLLERILEFRRDLFERFILESVRAGLKYRQKTGSPFVERK